MPKRKHLDFNDFTEFKRDLDKQDDDQLRFFVIIFAVIIIWGVVVIASIPACALGVPKC